MTPEISDDIELILEYVREVSAKAERMREAAERIEAFLATYSNRK